MFNKHDAGKILTMKQDIGSDRLLRDHHPRLSSSWSAVPPACRSSVAAAYYVPHSVVFNHNPSFGKIIYHLIFLILVENVGNGFFFKQGNTKTLGKLWKSFVPYFLLLWELHTRLVCDRKPNNNIRLISHVKVCVGGFQGNENTLCDTIMADTYRYTFIQTIGRKHQEWTLM